MAAPVMMQQVAQAVVVAVLAAAAVAMQRALVLPDRPAVVVEIMAVLMAVPMAVLDHLIHSQITLARAAAELALERAVQHPEAPLLLLPPIPLAMVERPARVVPLRRAAAVAALDRVAAALPVLMRLPRPKAVWVVRAA
jgi:hypothetical protein